LCVCFLLPYSFTFRCVFNFRFYFLLSFSSTPYSLNNISKSLRRVNFLISKGLEIINSTPSFLIIQRPLDPTSDGTTADDEGFPGEPRNPSVLIGFADHVAHSIWSGHVCTYFIPVIRK